MSFLISYNRKEVLQALRYHFIKQSEIKGLMIAVNIYAIVTAVLLFQKKIRPELFLFGSVLWLILMLLFWYLLPMIFYKKNYLNPIGTLAIVNKGQPWFQKMRRHNGNGPSLPTILKALISSISILAKSFFLVSGNTTKSNPLRHFILTPNR